MPYYFSAIQLWITTKKIASIFLIRIQLLEKPVTEMKLYVRIVSFSFITKNLKFM